ncbi:hypothetical protein LMOL312_1880 [Listeria monocytogenes L312]|nr:hypothetical protein LMOL312_1880 [Listeria monocytogenes L312]
MLAFQFYYTSSTFSINLVKEKEFGILHTKFF